MLNWILLSLGVFACAGNSIVMKSTSIRCDSKIKTMFCNGVTTLVATIIAFVSFFIQNGTNLPPDGLIWAVIFGTLFCITVFANLMALDYGPLSLTTLIVNFSLMLTLIYSFIFFDEKITPAKIVGIIVLIVCMILYANPKIRESEKKEKGDLTKWFLFSLIAFVGNGLLCIVQKNYAVSTDNAYADAFLAYGYLFATIASAAIFLFMLLSKKENETFDFKSFFRPSLIFLIFLLGGFNYLMNLMVVVLATRMDSVIVYPAIQMGGPIIVTIASRFIFKEKITLIKALAILLGCVAIIMLNF